jgi:hypothetical protein
MKTWFRLFLCLCLLTPVVPVDLTGAPKQSQKKSKKKQTPAQRKKEAERKKQMAERAAAVRKKKAQEDAREEKEKKDAENERINLQVAEIKKDIKFASYRLDDVELELKKISTARNVITQSIARALSKPEKPALAEARNKLLRIKEQVDAKKEQTKEAYQILGRLKIVCGKYLESNGVPGTGKKLFEAYENALLEVKRDFGSVESTIRKMKSYQSNYAGLVLPIISEFVQSGIQFSEKEEELIRKLRSL